MLAIVAALAASPPCALPAPGLTVQVDSHAHEVTVRSPVELPAGNPGSAYDAYHQPGAVTPLTPFVWPVDGWARGVRLRIFSCSGEVPAKRGVLHHALILDLGRRALTFPIYRRLLAFGRATDDIVMPKGVGLRLTRGDRLGLLAAWTPSAQGPERVMLELTIPYLPANLNPRPVDVVPLGFDVHYRPGHGASYDLPPGASTRERDYTLPIGGRLLVAGGHLHDYATGMTLTDLTSGQVVVDLRPARGDDGRVTGVSRQVWGAAGSGLKLEAGRTYRLRVSYDNPTGRVLTQGAMGILASLFVPDHADR